MRHGTCVISLQYVPHLFELTDTKKVETLPLQTKKALQYLRDRESVDLLVLQERGKEPARTEAIKSWMGVEFDGATSEDQDCEHLFLW